MPYKLADIELSEPLRSIPLAPTEDGLGLIGRWQGRLVGFHMMPVAAGSSLSESALETIANEHFAFRVLVAKVAAEMATPRWSPVAQEMPRLSVVICTKDRARRLARLLASLAAVTDRSEFSALEIVVIDNASVDSSTREATGAFANVRYVFEPKAGLNFARNAALGAATGDLIAYLDDDVVVDRNWLAGLTAAWRGSPKAGGFTGLVLPFRLDTDAQIFFEQRRGFGRGVARNEFRGSRFDNPLHPVGTGILGAGCNMAFDRALLIRLGGFDEALDTGAPLPGGGDLDIFYRVLRAGRTMVYEPQYAVYHEHRETMAQLSRQYWSWGLGFMAFLAKSRRTDGALRDRHRAMIRWWFGDQVRALLGAARRLRGRELRFRFAELLGGIRGLAGEYDRSLARVQTIRDRNP